MHAAWVAGCVLKLLKPGGIAVFIASILPARPGWAELKRLLAASPAWRTEVAMVQPPDGGGGNAAEGEGMPAYLWEGIENSAEDRHEMLAVWPLGDTDQAMEGKFGPQSLRPWRKQ